MTHRKDIIPERRRGTSQGNGLKCGGARTRGLLLRKGVDAARRAVAGREIKT